MNSLTTQYSADQNPKKMVQFHSSLILFLFLVLSTANGETAQVRDALVHFMEKLSPGNNFREENWGWNTSSDPCNDTWKGVICYNNSATVKKIVLDRLNLTGELDAASLCVTKTVTVVSLNFNNLVGTFPEDISKCSRLTHIYLHGNSFSGNLPANLSMLSNLKRVVLSDNSFSGNIPDMSRISGLLTFLAENNNLSGNIPKFDFSNLEEFNVSNNILTGPIPNGGARFNETSFSGNSGLCGNPLPNTCPPSPPPPPAKTKSSSRKDSFIYLGYVLLVLIIVSIVAYILIKKVYSSKRKNSNAAKKGFQNDSTQEKLSGATSSESKAANRSEFSITSAESERASPSLVVLSSPVANYALKFEDLLRSPAELMRKGRHGSLYKVIINDGMLTLAVKRIRDWDISKDDFKKRMQRIDQVKHPNVMPIVAFYCSSQEKLLVYEFEENGSLSGLLQGLENGKSFNWESRLNIAAKISDALAFMHEGLQADGIAHGNLKSSNILLNNEMEPLLSEYGLAEVEISDQDPLFLDSFQENALYSSPRGGTVGPNNDTARGTDIYSFGIILLELLTGKLAHNNGSDLARWVSTAIREEWTVEVFDQGIVSEGVSEERMLHLLHVALKCINTSLEARPCMREVAEMINSMKENEEEPVGESLD